MQLNWRLRLYTVIFEVPNDPDRQPFPDAGNKPRGPLPRLQAEFEVTLELTVACGLTQQQSREPISAQLCERFLSDFRFSGQLTSLDLDEQRYIVCYRQNNASLPRALDSDVDRCCATITSESPLMCSKSLPSRGPCANRSRAGTTSRIGANDTAVDHLPIWCVVVQGYSS